MLEYAILSLLREGSDHGYRLKRRLDRMLGPVWPVNAGQVYRQLDRLRKKGWVAELPPESGDQTGHERWPVALSPAGRAALRAWARAPIEPTRPPSPSRHEVVCRLRLAGPEAAPSLRAGLLRERLVFEAAREDLATGDRAPEPAEHLAIAAARLEIEAHLRWIELCLTELEAAGPPRTPIDGDL